MRIAVVMPLLEEAQRTVTVEGPENYILKLEAELREVFEAVDEDNCPLLYKIYAALPRG